MTRIPGGREVLNGFEDFLWENHRNIDVTYPAEGGKRELFAEYFTAHILGEKVPDEFIEFITVTIPKLYDDQYK